MASRVVDAVKGIANTITSWLHFSRPDARTVTRLRDMDARYGTGNGRRNKSECL